MSVLPMTAESPKSLMADNLSLASSSAIMAKSICTSKENRMVPKSSKSGLKADPLYLLVHTLCLEQLYYSTGLLYSSHCTLVHGQTCGWITLDKPAGDLRVPFLTGESLFKKHCFVICLPSPLLLQAALLTRTPTTWQEPPQCDKNPHISIF